MPTIAETGKHFNILNPNFLLRPASRENFQYWIKHHVDKFEITSGHPDYEVAGTVSIYSKPHPADPYPSPIGDYPCKIVWESGRVVLTLLDNDTNYEAELDRSGISKLDNAISIYEGKELNLNPDLFTVRLKDVTKILIDQLDPNTGIMYFNNFRPQPFTINADILTLALAPNVQLCLQDCRSDIAKLNELIYDASVKASRMSRFNAAIARIQDALYNPNLDDFTREAILDSINSCSKDAIDIKSTAKISDNMFSGFITLSIQRISGSRQTCKFNFVFDSTNVQKTLRLRDTHSHEMYFSSSELSTEILRMFENKEAVSPRRPWQLGEEAA